jgi:hypothetical protein
MPRVIDDDRTATKKRRAGCGAPLRSSGFRIWCYITGRDSAFSRFSTTPTLSPETSTGMFQ